MKRFFVALSLCMFALGTPSSYGADAAPDFKLPTPRGIVELNKLKGKVVYVDFWASWCTPCRKSFPWMNELNTKYKDQGLEVIAINLDKTRDPIDNFLRKTPANFTIAFDPNGTTASAYKLVGMPSSYVVDKAGQLQLSHIGFREKDKEEIEAKIKELLGSK